MRGEQELVLGEKMLPWPTTRAGPDALHRVGLGVRGNIGPGLGQRGSTCDFMIACVCVVYQTFPVMYFDRCSRRWRMASGGGH